jgi:hypothetical protein
MNELFPIATVSMDSPRLRWLKAHGVHTKYCVTEPIGWSAWVLEPSYLRQFAPTEDEAIVALAKAKGWRTWLEQDLK